MSAPKRWLDEAGSATRLERDLLRSGLSRELDPPPEAKAEVWASLLTQLPPPGGGAPSGGSAPGAGAKAAGAKAAAGGSGAGAAGAVGGGLLKSALIGAGSAVVVIAGYALVTPGSSALDPKPAPVILAPAAPRPRATIDDGLDLPNPPAPDATEAPSASASPRPPEKTADSSAAFERESRLREESQAISEARDALRSGDDAAALAKLEALGQKFPAGVLVQEREALSIEALHKSGRSAEAAARADAFLKAYPTSPHAPRIQAFTQ
jgi:hypothetical protein